MIGTGRAKVPTAPDGENFISRIEADRQAEIDYDEAFRKLLR